MLTITTPNITTSGSAKLKNYTFAGTNGRKFFTVKNLDDTTQVDFHITGGTASGFKLFPMSVASDSLSVLVGGSAAGATFSFAIDYNILWNSSGATSISLNSSVPIYDTTGSTIVLGPTASIVFDFSANETITSRDIQTQFIKDEDGNYQVEQIGSKISENTTSFGLARTNPALSGNVKITVDSNNDIWLNSFEAVKELSDDKYKRYALSKNSSYAVDLNRFFNNGKTPADIVFALYQNDANLTSTKKTLDQQYDKFYQYGVTELNSKYYEENFSFLAPMYLKTDIPEYFVIFRTDGPVNEFSYSLPIDQWPSEVINQILSKSKIVKTFNLGEKTPIGSYLRNIVNHPSRTETDLSVSYQTNGYTTFNGIAYDKGSFAQRGELLHDYYSQENPLITVEDFMTQGFQRNSIISSHIINLEFLFNDPTAPNYSINRYFGFYVNAIDLANFEIDENALQMLSVSIDQLPIPRKGIDGRRVSQKPFIQNNSNGVSVFVDPTTLVRTNLLDPKKVFSSIVTKFEVISDDLDPDYPNIRLTLPGNVLYRVSGSPIIELKSSNGLTASSPLISSYDSSYLNNSYFSGDDTILILDSASFQSAYTPFQFQESAKNLSCNFYTPDSWKFFNPLLIDNVFIEGQGRFFYIKDNKGDLHTIKRKIDTSYNSSVFSDTDVIQFQLGDTKFDMSKMGGFTSLLTQTDAVVLETKGKSAIEIEVTDYFQPNDFIEIAWSTGSTAGYPLRWRAIANVSGLMPGETWPTTSIDNDEFGQFYISYFNPGNSSITLAKFASSIAEAFNRFPYKDFEAFAKDSKVYFRSSQDGTISTNQILSYNTEFGVIKVMGTVIPSQGTVAFLGGSDRKFTRAKISAEVAQGMISTEYISTKGSFSLPKKYDVMGNTIIFAPYLDEPVYDSTGEKVIDFIGADAYYTVCLADESHSIQLTSHGMLTTYQGFLPSVGILSLMPFKDFDTDFFYSDYSRNYTAELKEYFGRFSSPTKVINYNDVTVTFDQNFTFDTYPMTVPFLILSNDGSTSPQLHNSDFQLIFHSAGNIATTQKAPGVTVTWNLGDTILLIPGVKANYFSDLELAKFKGFLSLTSVVSTQDENEFNVLENLWDPSRFTFQLVNSEYDRLAENYLKTLVLKSRMVPYITKWVTPQGKDIRDNPYRFNYHRVFGNTGFSPSGDMFLPDPKFHTHEWPYLDAVPDNFDPNVFSDYSFSYMFQKLSSKYDFSSLSKDWFSEYFTTGFPTELYFNTKDQLEYTPLLDPSEKYSYFNYLLYNDTTEVLFRGYKFNIKELDQSGNPINLSKKYDGYRFSSIIETIEDNSMVVEDPLTFTTIVNEKWKFIFLKITIRTSSYRFSTGNVRYTDLYTLFNNEELGKYEFDSSQLVIEKSLPTDRKLSVGVNFGKLYSNDPSLSGHIGYYDAINTGSSYNVDLREEIVTLDSGLFSNLIATNQKNYGNLSISSTISLPTTIDVYSSNTLRIESGKSYMLVQNTLTFPITKILPINNDWSNYVIYQQEGGNLSYNGIRERLTFAEIIKVIDGTSAKSKMNYEIYKEDGITLKSPNFKISAISPESLTRIYDYFPVSDSDKPQEFYSIPTIGFNLSQQKDLQTIYRYQGNFSPKFKDVLKFWLREDNFFTDTVSRDFLLLNTHLGTELKDFGKLKNQYYAKVADNEILRISPSSGYQPVYPLINEIAIDKKDIFAWSSTWDQHYYRKYSAVNTFQDVPGTSSMPEMKSLFGSKVMQVPSEYSLYQFEILNSTSASLSSYINDEFVYFEDTKNAYIQVNVYNKLLREMLGTSTDPRAKAEFLKVMNLIPGTFDPSTINDFVSTYLKDNILDLFQISQTNFYILQTGNPGNGTIATTSTNTQQRPIVESMLDSEGNVVTLGETQLFNKGYTIKKDVKVTTIGNMIFQITYPLDSRFYTSFSVGVVVNRI